MPCAARPSNTVIERARVLFIEQTVQVDPYKVAINLYAVRAELLRQLYFLMILDAHSQIIVSGSRSALGKSLV